ncbi:recombinase family protein [Clostridium cibarium]|uniref:Recombinase family protein n=1 Tax=Clostridium cibarium TaxID=2762247 RepID=A0ABR8PXQ4_9CLOT|nr:recombinase family protein [Clostridium cibarium]MBD7912933.1 recombinase family protein [Clostridium cibarium]
MKINEFINSIEKEDYKIGDFRNTKVFTNIINQEVRIAVYARISNLRDKDTSVQRQLEYINDFLSDINIDKEVIETYIDEGISGTNKLRPAYQRMLEDINNGKRNIVIVVNMDRFGRDCVEIVDKLYNLFISKNVIFIALDDMIVNTNEDRLELIKKAVLAEEYCKDISKKVRKANKVKMKKGSSIASKAPYGYRIEKILGEGYLKYKRIYIVDNDDKPEIVRLIFRLYIEGNGYGEIAKILNEKKYISPNGGIWSKSTIASILQNPLYGGIFAQGRYKKNGYINSGEDKKITKVDKEGWILGEGFSGIVTQELFLQVQELIKSRTSSRNKGEIHLFSGVLRCGDCGKTLVYKKRDKGYKCASSQSNGGCSTHFVKEEELKQMVLDHIHKLKWDMDMVKDEVGQIANEMFYMDRIDTHIDRLNNEIKKLDKKIVETYGEYKEEIINERIYKLLIKDCEENIKKIEQQIKILSIKKNNVKVLNQRIKTLINWLSSLNDIDNSILRLLIKQINIFESGTIEIIWNIRKQSEDINESQNECL